MVKYLSTGQNHHRKEVIDIKRFAKLRGRIVEKYGTQARFAEFLGITEQTVTAKLSEKTAFTLDEIVVWCNALDIQTDEVGVYFFEEKLSKG